MYVNAKQRIRVTVIKLMYSLSNEKIDTLILGCTHYPLLYKKIRKYVPDHIKIMSQGSYVAQSLQNYLERHATLQALCSQHGTCTYYTTENAERFQESAKIFLHADIQVEHICLE